MPSGAKKNKKINKRTLSHELSGILEDVNTTLQGLPIPRFKGAVELLKDLNEKWKNNTPIYLVAEGICFFCSFWVVTD